MNIYIYIVITNNSTCKQMRKTAHTCRNLFIRMRIYSEKKIANLFRLMFDQLGVFFHSYVIDQILDIRSSDHDACVAKMAPSLKKVMRKQKRERRDQEKDVMIT